MELLDEWAVMLMLLIVINIMVDTTDGIVIVDVVEIIVICNVETYVLI